MKLEGKLFLSGVVFYLLVAAAYFWMTQDETGTVLLVLTGGLAGLVSFYILFTSKQVFPRPEDRLDGEIHEADPDYGFFSPHSWMPLAVAAPAAVISFAVAMGQWWMVVTGVAGLVLGVFGWLFEYMCRESL